MTFKEKLITVKNGSTAILKSPSTEDAEALLDCMKTASEETHFLLRYAEEWKLTAAQEANWISNAANSQASMIICCYINGEMIGNCQITFGSCAKTSHRASISIVILREYWNLGIGSAMLAELINTAREHGTEIVELEYMEGNERGRRLYEKFGFRIIGERPNAFKLKDGTVLSEVFMQLYL